MAIEKRLVLNGNVVIAEVNTETGEVVSETEIDGDLVLGAVYDKMATAIASDAAKDWKQPAVDANGSPVED